MHVTVLEGENKTSRAKSCKTILKKIYFTFHCIVQDELIFQTTQYYDVIIDDFI